MTWVILFKFKKNVIHDTIKSCKKAGLQPLSKKLIFEKQEKNGSI